MLCIIEGPRLEAFGLLPAPASPLMPARRFPPPWSALINHLFEQAWAFSPSTRRVQTQVPPVAGAAMVANEWPDGGQRRF